MSDPPVSFGKTIVTIDQLEGELVLPPSAQSVILFAHGNGSSRDSTRNQLVARILNEAGFATLLIDLLTPNEKKKDEQSRLLRYDTELLSERILKITRWLQNAPETRGFSIGYFGSSTGATAAIVAAARINNHGTGNIVKTIVCRGGRPDLANSTGKKDVLGRVSIPILFIVGGNDKPVIALNRDALKSLSNTKTKELAIIQGAGHLFEEPGMMEQVAALASKWFQSYLLMNGSVFENRNQLKSPRLLAFLKELADIQMKFRDRASAGETLTSLLKSYRIINGDLRPITVIGIPRGGVIVAERVSRKLNTELDLVFPRKLRAPNNPENAIGAVMQDGSVHLDNSIINTLEISKEYINSEIVEQKKEIARRMKLYRPLQREYNIKDRTVLLIDDGAATGATIIAAATWVRAQNPKLLVIGLPVASKAVTNLLAAIADRVEVVQCPAVSKFKTVELFYEDFTQVTDAEVLQVLKETKKAI